MLGGFPEQAGPHWAHPGPPERVGEAWGPSDQRNQVIRASTDPRSPRSVPPPCLCETTCRRLVWGIRCLPPPWSVPAWDLQEKPWPRGPHVSCGPATGPFRAWCSHPAPHSLTGYGRPPHAPGGSTSPSPESPTTWESLSSPTGASPARRRPRPQVGAGTRRGWPEPLLPLTQGRDPSDQEPIGQLPLF